MQSFSKMALWSSYKQFRKTLVSNFLCFDTRFDNNLRSWQSIYKIVHRPFLKMIAQVGCRHSSVDSSAPSILMPGFKSQAHHLCYNQLQSNLSLHCEKNKNKQKRPGLVHLKNDCLGIIDDIELQSSRRFLLYHFSICWVRFEPYNTIEYK